MKVTSENSRLGGDVGDDKWPPGFRFHPTDEELVLYYLKRKICKKRLRLDIVRVLDVYKWDPEELPGQSILKTGDRQYFFFCPRDRKYPNGGRSNRATRHGYWKATGKDRNITCNSRTVGIKKTLVFYAGRAPNGIRTDWVMHEYTLDEEELKRCLNAQDYYALCKVYKKSGPGPKNGEQYGAPFKEEEWADDECAGVVNSVAPVKQQNVVAPPADNTKAIAQVELPLTDLEEFMKQMTGANPFDLPEITDYANGLPQVASEGETQSTLLDPSCREVIYTETVSILPTSDQQSEKVSLDFYQSATSKMQLHDAAEVTSAPNSIRAPLICEDDFLEIDDLIGPEPTFSNPEKPVKDLGLDDFDGLTEFDLYHDADFFWNDMGPVGQETVSHVSSVGSELQSHSLSNQVDYQLQPHSNLNQVDCQLQSHSAVNGMHYLQPHLTVNGVDYMQSPTFGADQLWDPYQRSDVFAGTESLQETLTEATPGVMRESTNNQNQSGEEDAGSAGWLSSTLWAFVESIPTTPASASENPLVNKAFERMSSFSRIRMNVKKININCDNLNAPNVAANARKGSGSRGLFLLSIFGALCALLWVLVGTVRVVGRSNSFSS
ncbi:NAC domain-containing protein 17-like [Euphorbia lathyris]|uniref:NAC domain-containing protein 17-like n=1 Tax=Euphorbia lathyris TaxID=212925 RepID=UPI0033132DC6